MEYRSYSGPCRFYIIKNLKEKVGASVLIGVNLIKKVPILLAALLSDNTKILKPFKNYSIPQATVANIVNDFKKIGAFDPISNKYNLSIQTVSDSIQQYKKFRNDAEYVNWILKAQSKLSPNWWENTIKK